MTKRSKIQGEQDLPPATAEDLEAVDGVVVVRDEPRDNEQALLIDNMLEAATIIADAAATRSRVSKFGPRRYNPTKRDRKMVLVMLWAGHSHEEIAKALGMTDETMRNHFAFELEQGTRLLIADMTKGLVAKAMAGDLGAMDRVLRRWGGNEWREAISPSKGATAVQVNVGEGAVGVERIERNPEDVERVIDVLTERVKARIEGK